MGLASVQFSSVQSFSHVRLFATPWTAAHQASLPITNSWSPPKPMSIESVMPSNHLILCRPLLLPPPINSSIKVFSNESALRIRWPKYRSFSFTLQVLNKHLSNLKKNVRTEGFSRWRHIQSPLPLLCNSSQRERVFYTHLMYIFSLTCSNRLSKAPLSPKSQ